MKRKKRILKYEVNFSMTSGGAKFTSLTGALDYLRHCMKSGNSGSSEMTIVKLNPPVEE